MQYNHGIARLGSVYSLPFPTSTVLWPQGTQVGNHPPAAGWQPPLARGTRFSLLLRAALKTPSEYERAPTNSGGAELASAT